MYGKIFDSIYKGTLYGHWEAIITFQQFIVLCDADGIVDMTPQAIAATTSIPLEIIQKGIEVLQNPDPYSRTPGEDGRRITLIEDHRPWGWVIVNHQKYKTIQDADTVRAQTRERVRKHREKKKVEAENVTGCNGQKRHTNTNTNTRSIYTQKFEETWKTYPKRSGSNDKKKAFKAWNARLNEGHTEETMAAGTLRYTVFCKTTGKMGSEFVMQAATFYGPADPPHFSQDWEAPKQTQQPKTDQDWISRGNSLGVTARPGESMSEFIQRVQVASRAH